MKPLYLLLGLSLLLSACSDDAANKAKAGPTPLQIEATTVTRQSLGQAITRTGTLRAEQEVKLLAEEEGRVDKVPFYEGDRVKQGDLLLQLDDAQLVVPLGYGPIRDNMGLFHIVSSSESLLSLAFSACDRLMPDAPYYQGCLQEAFVELLRSARDRV